MKTYKICLLIPLLTYILSCSNNPQNEYTVEDSIEFDIEKDLKEDDSLQLLIDEIEFVELKSDNDFLIGAISKAYLDNKFIYIMDQVSKSLFKYTREGEPVLKIHAVGNGPGEYTRLTDFAVKNDTIILLDAYSFSLLFYDDSGKFIKKIKTKSDAEKFAVFQDNIYLYSGNQASFFSDDNIRIIDFKGNTVSSYFKIPSYLKNKGFSTQQPFVVSKDDLTFMNTFDTNVYSLSKDSVCIKYKLDFQKNNIESSFFEENEDTDVGNMLKKASKDRKVYALDYFNRTNDFLSFTFICKGGYYAYYNIKNKERGLYKFKKIEKTSYINILKYIVESTIASNENRFIAQFASSLPEEWELSTIKSLEENVKTKNIEALYNVRNNEDANPILILYKLM